MKMHLYKCLFSLADDGTTELQIIQVSEDVVIIIIVKRANSIVVASDVSVDKQVKETILVGVFGMYHILLSSQSVSGNTSTVSIFIQKGSICTYDSLPIDKAYIVVFIKDPGMWSTKKQR